MKGILLMLCLLLTACAPGRLPAEEAAAVAVSARPAEPAYEKAALGQTVDAGFARLKFEDVDFAPRLQQGYSAIFPASEAQVFCRMTVRVENLCGMPLPTEHFLCRMTFPGCSFRGSVHCFSGDTLAPGEAAQVQLFAAVPQALRQEKAQVRLLFHDFFAAPDGTPLPHRYVVEGE